MQTFSCCKNVQFFFFSLENGQGATHRANAGFFKLKKMFNQFSNSKPKPAFTQFNRNKPTSVT